MEKIIMTNENPIIIVSIKGGPGSGNWGHAGRPGMVGGSSGGGGAFMVELSSTTSDAELADQISHALDGKTFGEAIPIVIKQLETEQTIFAHIVQRKIGGRVIMSREIERYGEPYQLYESMSMRGKNRGKLRFESSDPQSLMEERGFTADSGYLTR